MTPDETQLLRKMGLWYLLVVENLFLCIFFYGVFVVLFSASIVIFLRRGFSDRAKVVMFAAIGLCFFLSTLYVGMYITAVVQVIRKTLADNIGDTLSERPRFTANSVYIIINWSTTLPILFSDLILIWRASVLFPGQRRVIIGPFILWLGSVVTSAIFLIWLLTPSGSYAYATGGFNRYLVLAVANLGFSIATNAIATAMIAYKLWCVTLRVVYVIQLVIVKHTARTHRTTIVKNLGLKGWRGPVQNILILLVESGLVYLVLQIVAFALDIVGLTHWLDIVNSGSKSSEQYATLAFSDIYVFVTQMYPTIVILLVETQRSMVVICGISPSSTVKDMGLPTPHAVTLGHSSFSAGLDESATDKSLSLI